jgi:hypothetical protein
MIGIAGGCRREELYNISLDDIQETQTQLVITITTQFPALRQMKEGPSL